MYTYIYIYFTTINSDINLFFYFFQRPRKRDCENFVVRSCLKRMVVRQNKDLLKYKDLLTNVHAKNKNLMEEIKNLMEEISKLRMENTTLSTILERECAVTVIFQEDNENI